VAVQDDVLLSLIDEPEHHFQMASHYFARGDYTRSAAEISAGAAFERLESTGLKSTETPYCPADDTYKSGQTLYG
jgi:hypothetical protein